MSLVIPESFLIALQIIVSAGLINVWVLRFNKKTAYRGKGAQSMKDEFRAYGLSESFMKLIGFLKLSVAAFLLIGIWLPTVAFYSALLLVGLMAGAILMHLKVKDPLVRFIPATFLFLLAIIIASGRLDASRLL